MSIHAHVCVCIVASSFNHKLSSPVVFVLYFVIIDNHLIVSVCCGSNCCWVWVQMSTVTMDWNQLESLWNESGVRVQLIYTIKDHRQPSSA